MFGLFHLCVQVARSEVSYAGGAWREGREAETANKPSLGRAKVACLKVSCAVERGEKVGRWR